MWILEQFSNLKHAQKVHNQKSNNLKKNMGRGTYKQFCQWRNQNKWQFSLRPEFMVNLHRVADMDLVLKKPRIRIQFFLRDRSGDLEIMGTNIKARNQIRVLENLGSVSSFSLRDGLGTDPDPNLFGSLRPQFIMSLHIIADPEPFFKTSDSGSDFSWGTNPHPINFNPDPQFWNRISLKIQISYYICVNFMQEKYIYFIFNFAYDCKIVSHYCSRTHEHLLTWEVEMVTTVMSIRMERNERPQNWLTTSLLVKAEWYFT